MSSLVLEWRDDATLLNLKRQQKIDDHTYFKLRSTDCNPPAIRGFNKHHKDGYPLRPIVTCIGSALYNTSEFLTDILASIQNGNGFSVANSQQFSNEIADVIIQDDETMVSFDVVSLFTAIPVDKACDYIRKKLEDDSSLHSRTKLDIEDIISLLNFVLSNNYFVYNDTIYKQIHGYAMGSPVSPVVASLCMEEIEKTAINATPVSSNFWKRYVDDSFCIIALLRVTLLPPSTIHSTLSISIFLSPSNTSPTANYPFLTPSCRATTENSWLISTADPHIQISRYLDFHSHRQKT